MRILIWFTIGLLLIMTSIRSAPDGSGTIGSMIGALITPEFMKEV